MFKGLVGLRMDQAPENRIQTVVLALEVVQETSVPVDRAQGVGRWGKPDNWFAGTIACDFRAPAPPRAVSSYRGRPEAASAHRI